MHSLTRHLSRQTLPTALLLLVTAGCASAPTSAPQSNDAVAAEPTAAPEAGEPEHTPNKLRWTTASEVDNFGFDVYRGDHEEGPFARLTERPITGAGTTDLTTEYSYEDLTHDPYRTYYYYVESISLQGVREQFTPIIKAEPKLTADGDESDETAEGAANGDS